MDIKEHLEKALLKAWFPKNHNDEEWLKSADGFAWQEIASLDAEVIMKAYEEYYQDDLK